MRRFPKLGIWNDPSVKKGFDWYYKVSNNAQPAKYLICKHIKCEVSLDSDESTLWQEHKRLVGEFESVFSSIRRNESDLSKFDKSYPSFMDLKAELANRLLRHCNFCEWNCRIDRTTRHGACMLESQSRVGSYFHHSGEELPIRGTEGSGTIFFTSCNMRCVFCQNGDISHDKDNGFIVTTNRLADIMRKLRLEGCHNINLVGGEPTIHLHTIMNAIRSLDLNVPIIWNSNFYMTMETMKLLWEIIDIWLPDYKFGNDGCAWRLSKTMRYTDVVTRNCKLVYDSGMDMLVRHLIMPNHVECCTKPVLKWISMNCPDSLVNIMDQYHPEYLASTCSRYADISGLPSRTEIKESYAYAKSLGIHFDPISFA
ncbi:MAG: radical SAM protein [Nitrososphaerales archaeon]